MEDQDLKILLSHVKKIIPDYLETEAFTRRKLTDIPTDNLAVTNRKYVNMFASVATLPQASVIGQQVFATDLGYPVFRRQDGKWVSAAGSVVA